MAAPVLPSVLLLLGLLPAAGRGGEGAEGRPAAAVAPALAVPGPYQRRARAVEYPDTTRKPAAVADTTQVRPAPAALTPDEDEKLTRKSVLYVVGAIAVLTLTTLLLYNVRSR